MNQLRKNQLIVKLEYELKVFEQRGYPTKDHLRAIDFLKTGNKYDCKGDLLEACINDFDCIYNDYCN